MEPWAAEHYKRYAIGFHCISKANINSNCNSFALLIHCLLYIYTIKCKDMGKGTIMSVRYPEIDLHIT
jgi:hypothetical protein